MDRWRRSADFAETRDNICVFSSQTSGRCITGGIERACFCFELLKYLLLFVQTLLILNWSLCLWNNILVSVQLRVSDVLLLSCIYLFTFLLVAADYTRGNITKTCVCVCVFAHSSFNIINVITDDKITVLYLFYGKGCFEFNLTRLVCLQRASARRPLGSGIGTSYRSAVDDGVYLTDSNETRKWTAASF